MKLKKLDTKELSTNEAPMALFYQGNKSRYLTYALVSAIKYLTTQRILCGIDHLADKLLEINQQDLQLVQKANNIMRKNGYFEYKQLNKTKRKQNPGMNILDEMLLKNTIYVCSLIASIGDNLYIIAIVNNWIFDANFKRAKKHGQKRLDKCCKHNSTDAT